MRYHQLTMALLERMRLGRRILLNWPSLFVLQGPHNRTLPVSIDMLVEKIPDLKISSAYLERKTLTTWKRRTRLMEEAGHNTVQTTDHI